MSINLVSFNVTYTNSVVYVSWDMNSTVSAIGGPTITLQNLNITAQNVNDLTTTIYNITLSNYTTTTVVSSGGVRTYRNQFTNATFYDGGSINYLNLTLGETYNFSGQAKGSSQATGFPAPPAVDITSSVVYATGSPLQVGSLPPVCFLKGTKILCANGEYRLIEDLQKGDMVKTHLHGDVAVDILCNMDIHHSRKEDQRD